mgnify:CR=1 FL=1
MRRRSAIVACALALGCGEGFLPPSYVNELRVLAVRTEPPEIAWGAEEIPSESRISVLVADPVQLLDPTREVVVGYLSCTADPASLEPNPCTAITTLRAPSELARHLPEEICEAGGGGTGEGRTPFAFLGAERCRHVEGCEPLAVPVGEFEISLPPPVFRLPDDLGLSALPAGHPARTRGAQVVVLTFAVAAAPAELVEGVDGSDECRLATTLMSRFFQLLEERESVMALKRIQVRGPDHRNDPNENPRISGILVRGVPLPAEPGEPWPEVATFAREQSVFLHPRPAPAPLDDEGRPLHGSEKQSYTRYRRDGTPLRTEVEEWRYSWFSTGGRFSEDRDETEGGITWTAPGGKKDDPVPPGGRTFLYLVVRDGRGGVDWVRREVRVQ